VLVTSHYFGWMVAIFAAIPWMGHARSCPIIWDDTEVVPPRCYERSLTAESGKLFLHRHFGLDRIRDETLIMREMMHFIQVLVGRLFLAGKF
jgi:hypothetical protein